MDSKILPMHADCALWKDLRATGAPSLIVNLIKRLHEGYNLAPSL